jgi:hypothetical protein
VGRLTEHLVVRNGAVAVNVVQLEGPAQLLVEAPARRHREGTDELLEVDGAVAILVEDVEDELGKGGRVAKGKEGPVCVCAAKAEQGGKGARSASV